MMKIEHILEIMKKISDMHRDSEKNYQRNLLFLSKKTAMIQLVSID